MPDETNHKRINANALEMIMRDVLAGMQGFSGEVCRNPRNSGLEIIGTDQDREIQQAAASIIPFPLRNDRQ
jgi:hypothetical protein